MSKIKKSSFGHGAFIATLGIVISKLLGILYVIPFYSLIGKQGIALYGYAFGIYSVFLGFSEVGIPLAISKLTSEYVALEHYQTKRRAFRIGATVLSLVGLISFISLFVSAPFFANTIIGDISGGNTVEDVTFVLRVVSTSVLIVPLLSVTKGYLQGHNYISATSVSQVVEQLVRVIIIIVGSYIALKVFNLSTRDAIAISLFAGTVSAVVALLYLINIIYNYKDEIERPPVVIEPKVSTKSILIKLIVYALPFVFNDLGVTFFNNIDILTLLKSLVNTYGYTVEMGEAIVGVISTSGSKLNMIPISIHTGILVSLIPSISSSIASNNYKDINQKINKSYQMVIFIIIPMVVGLSFLSTHVWTIFYGVNDALLFGGEAYKLYAYASLTAAFFQLSITIIQLLRQYRTVIGVILSTIIMKVLLNPVFLFVFSKTPFPTYYGAFVATLISHIVPSLFALYYLHRNLAINYKQTLKLFISVLLTITIMYIVLFVLRIVWPLGVTSRISSLITIMVFAVVGIITYGFVTYKLKTMHFVFGKDTVSKLEKILRIKK